MKNLKMMIALVCFALPAATFGQATVSCDGCTHELSVYYGSGGFIAEADMDELGDDGMVVWVATCGSVTVDGELKPDNGKVAVLLSDDNGLACHNDDIDENQFQLGPVMDNGWFWVTDTMSSAVGSLVAQDVLENDGMIEPVSAGSGVDMMEGRGAYYLKETETGRVGILPTILPMPDMEPEEVNTCSFHDRGAGASPRYTREMANCMLGDGGSTLRVQGPTDIFTGVRAKIAAKGRVTRPAENGGTVDVKVDLWGNGSGHFTTDATSGDPRLGHATIPLAVTALTAAVGSGGPGSANEIDGSDATDDAGMTFAVADNVGTLTITSHASWCDPNAKPPVSHTATVTFVASLDEAGRGQVTPSLRTVPTRGPAAAARQSIMVTCPRPPSAHQGQELVPENPFPVN
ncbi:MAG: hypothetical protein F4X59_17310 [Holophagales bacterium]|nr:hypothetical protein [Holophagales bacterium]